MSTLKRVRAVTNHTAEYLHHWCASAPEFNFHDEAERCAAQALLAAGNGAARIPTCMHALCLPSDDSEDRCFHRLVLRTLSLFDKGELRDLRVVDPMILALVLGALNNEAAPRSACVSSGKLTQALSKLQAVAWSGYSEDFDDAFALIERFADTITALDCEIPYGYEIADKALARCTRLESLTDAISYSPSVWLGLSHLRILKGVDFEAVPAATIAAALPLLHTLGVVARSGDPTIESVAGFFDTLLPRLSVFRYTGPWPASSGSDGAAQIGAPARRPHPLPSLEELVWDSSCAEGTVLRRFMGAQPVTLHASSALIAEFLTVTAELGDDSSRAASVGPLSRVRDLKFITSSPEQSDVPRLLRAAPQLRHFDAGWLDGEFLWVDDEQNAMLVHKRLRSLHVSLARHCEMPPRECAAWLRQVSFPRLQRLVIEGRDCFVTIESDTDTSDSETDSH